MDLNNLRETGNFEDRRGQGGGFGGFGGPSWGGGFGGMPAFGLRGGGLGFIAFVILILLFGSNGGGGLLDSVLSGGGSYQQQQTGVEQPGAHSDEAEFDLARKIVGSAEDVWAPILQARGVTFSPAVITFYDNQTPTACGTGQASAGPFYCPNDRRIYLDLSFFNQLADQFGAPGQFAQAYVIAHEYGHHIQNLVGTMDRQESALQGSGSRGAAGASVRLELQADCYAGVWTYHANERFHILQQGDVEGGLRAAAAVGDDTLQKEGQGYVVPDSFTHGTSAQRMRWFQRGLSRGEMSDCDTFGAATL